MEVVDIVKSMTKYAVRLKKAEDVRYEIEKAVYYSLEGRPGPVLIDLPDDLQRQEINEKKLKSFTPTKRIVNINNSSLKKFNYLMSKSKRPIIVLGNGIKISKTEKKIYKIINKNRLPFATTWATTDLFDLDIK